MEAKGLLIIFVYWLIGFFIIQILNGFSRKDIEAMDIGVAFVWPILLAVLIGIGLVTGVWKLGDKIGRMLSDWYDNLDL